MFQFALPVLYGLFVWWFSTGVVLYVVRKCRAKLPIIMTGATAVLAVSAWGLMAGRELATVGGVYLAFTCAILVWGWAEITFLSGFLTGMGTRACPPGCTGWRRAGHAINSILYHELVLVALAGIVVALTRNGSNQVASATFLLLWVMRLSAKLNLFLGVPILNDEFLPEALGHLKSFFVRGPTNPLFPVVVTTSTVVAGWLVMQALAASSAFETAQYLLLATLLGLAILEHWFMVVPLPVSTLWQWGMAEDGNAPSQMRAHSVAAVCAVPAKPAEARAGSTACKRASERGAASSPQPRPNDRNPAPEAAYLAADIAPTGTGGLPQPLLAAIWRRP